MSGDQAQLVLVIVVTVGLFLWGRWRHDVVAMAALLVCVLLGVGLALPHLAPFAYLFAITWYIFLGAFLFIRMIWTSRPSE